MCWETDVADEKLPLVLHEWSKSLPFVRVLCGINHRITALEGTSSDYFLPTVAPHIIFHAAPKDHLSLAVSVRCTKGLNVEVGLVEIVSYGFVKYYSLNPNVFMGGGRDCSPPHHIVKNS